MRMLAKILTLQLLVVIGLNAGADWQERPVPPNYRQMAEQEFLKLLSGLPENVLVPIPRALALKLFSFAVVRGFAYVSPSVWMDSALLAKRLRAKLPFDRAPLRDQDFLDLVDTVCSAAESRVSEPALFRRDWALIRGYLIFGPSQGRRPPRRPAKHVAEPKSNLELEEFIRKLSSHHRTVRYAGAMYFVEHQAGTVAVELLTLMLKEDEEENVSVAAHALAVQEGGFVALPQLIDALKARRGLYGVCIALGKWKAFNALSELNEVIKERGSEMASAIEAVGDILESPQLPPRFFPEDPVTRVTAEILIEIVQQRLVPKNSQNILNCRTRAIRALSDMLFGEAYPLLKELATSPKEANAIQVVAIETLANFLSQGAEETLLSLALSTENALEGTPEERRFLAAIKGLTSLNSESAEFLNLLLREIQRPGTSGPTDVAVAEAVQRVYEVHATRSEYFAKRKDAVLTALSQKVERLRKDPLGERRVIFFSRAWHAINNEYLPK